MRTLLTGDCNPDNVFMLVDPTSFLENEFVAEVARALACLMPEYECRPFTGAFRFEEEVRKADLAMIHKKLSHWIVVEVEMVGHSLDGHVLPQLRCFRFGEAEQSCVSSMLNAFSELRPHEAKRIVAELPRYTICIANMKEPLWTDALRGLQIDLLTVSVYEGRNGRRAYEIDGRVNVKRESLGFVQYSGVYTAIKVPNSIPIPLGLVQIEDQFGVVADWTATEDGDVFWLTKNNGFTLLQHNCWVQILRHADGRIAIRQSSGQ